MERAPSSVVPLTHGYVCTSPSLCLNWSLGTRKGADSSKHPGNCAHTSALKLPFGHSCSLTRIELPGKPRAFLASRFPALTFHLLPFTSLESGPRPGGRFTQLTILPMCEPHLESELCTAQRTRGSYTAFWELPQYSPVP